MERQTSDAAPDAADPAPPHPKAPPGDHDHPAAKPKVTPLDEDKNIEKGIEITET